VCPILTLDVTCRVEQTLLRNPGKNGVLTQVMEIRGSKVWIDEYQVNSSERKEDLGLSP
jgi:hypothetical protein